MRIIILTEDIGHLCLIHIMITVLIIFLAQAVVFGKMSDLGDLACDLFLTDYYKKYIV